MKPCGPTSLQLQGPSFIMFLMNICIQNGRILDPATGLDKIANILISDTKIERIFQPEEQIALPDDLKVIDAEDLIVSPGLVDIHVHFREPGFTHKEEIATGAEAAVAGGYTTVVMMANTKPVIDNAATLREVEDKIRFVNAKTPLRILPSASVSMDLKGKQLTDFEALSLAGAAGFTDDGIPIMDEALLKEAFRLAAKVGKPVSLHEEDPALITENGINAGKVSKALQITGSPREAEISMIRRDIRIAENTGAKVNIQHLSTKEGVELIRQARKTNPDIHAEVTPHHFSLTEDAVLQYGTLAKMNPPLRTQEDRLALIEGLKDGTIETIATDHAPHAAEEKALPLTKAPSGIIGLETALSLGITNLVRPGHLTLLQLLEKMSFNPAKLYGIPCGIREGADADLVLFDPDHTKVYDRFRSRSSNSPFLGLALYGVVRATICGGRIAYEDLP